ncbi:cytochrome P450 [Amycolatopsis pithecellobii]|uniref:Cytochrome P450 n=1 Tax=Amycolatopsis pithecellobii TaxID=664692 RepID=A0A6N7Z1S7_9PSEU|nr:cytochrome P450 [Amycolatopsis pithecellobii]MTD55413.1 cytochrome P450 [Amycolatopsis pithecellobii]
MADSPFDPFSQSHHAAAEQALADARARVTCPYPGMAVVADNATVREVLGDVDRFSNEYNFDLERGPAPAERDPMNTVIARSDPPFHTEIRRFLRRWFEPARLRKLEPRVRELVKEAVAEIPDHGRADLVHHLGRVIPGRTVYTIIGVPTEDWDRMQALSDELNANLPAASPGLIGQIMDIFVRVLKQRRESGERRDDVIDGLVHPGEGLSFDDVVAARHLLQLFVAGADTTTSLIGNVLYRLLEEPSRWDRVVADPSLAAAAVEESLRRDSPLQYTLRTTVTGTQLAGCPVTPKDRVVLSLQSANWDEHAWGDSALEFDLDRVGVAAHLAFGSGIHTCLGAPIARIEARVIIEALAERFPRMRLSDGFTIEYVPAPQMRLPRSLLVDVNPSMADEPTSRPTQLEVDRDRCEGHGLCENAAPDLVHLDDDGMLVIDQSDVPAHLSGAAAQAVQVCPVAALRLR